MRNILSLSLTTVLSFATLCPQIPGRAQEAAKAEPGACRKTSEAELKACSATALANLWIENAKCENLSTAAERKSCKDEAAKAAKSAAEDCHAQHQARLAVCKDLGKEPYDPVIDPGSFVEGVDNPLFPLRPGTTYIYENRLATGTERTEVMVTHNRRVIAGVGCVEVRSVTTSAGALQEDALDWFAQDRDGNVWYFGENSKEYANGLVVGLSGSWMSGENGAKPGLIFEAHPQAGQRYRQEYLPGSAEAVREILALDGSVTVSTGSYTGCVVTEDLSALEPDETETKYFAPGVGLVQTVYTATGDHEDLIEIIAP